MQQHKKKDNSTLSQSQRLTKSSIVLGENKSKQTQLSSDAFLQISKGQLTLIAIIIIFFMAILTAIILFTFNLKSQINQIKTDMKNIQNQLISIQTLQKRDPNHQSIKPLQKKNNLKSKFQIDSNQQFKKIKAKLNSQNQRIKALQKSNSTFKTCFNQIQTIKQKNLQLQKNQSIIEDASKINLLKLNNITQTQSKFQIQISDIKNQQQLLKGIQNQRYQNLKNAIQQINQYMKEQEIPNNLINYTKIIGNQLSLQLNNVLQKNANLIQDLSLIQSKVNKFYLSQNKLNSQKMNRIFNYQKYKSNIQVLALHKNQLRDLKFFNNIDLKNMRILSLRKKFLQIDQNDLTEQSLNFLFNLNLPVLQQFHLSSKLLLKKLKAQNFGKIQQEISIPIILNKFYATQNPSKYVTYLFNQDQSKNTHATLKNQIRDLCNQDQIKYEKLHIVFLQKNYQYLDQLIVQKYSSYTMLKPVDFIKNIFK